MERLKQNKNNVVNKLDDILENIYQKLFSNCSQLFEKLIIYKHTVCVIIFRKGLRMLVFFCVKINDASYSSLVAGTAVPAW